MTKQYDRAYFDKWYRSRNHRVHDRSEVRRKTIMAVSLAEYFLRRPIETVLDVGAGEGAWLPRLRAVRRGIEYVGVDPSDYAVERFGASRNLRKGGFADLASLRFRDSFDLVICSDVMHYLSERDLRAGLPELARLTGAIAYIEVLTKEDEIIGDLDGLIPRPAAFYKRLIERAGFAQAGPYCWLGPEMREVATKLELP